jgi:hypothetical protein
MTNQIKKTIALWGMSAVRIAFAGLAFAQPSPDTAAAGSAATGSAATATSEPPSPASPPSPQPAADARKACTDAMNADPKFAEAIIKVADEKAAVKRDADTLAAHEDAVAHVQKNERHVIYGYAAIWIITVLFVIFMWRRQQALKTEIANLRHDLDAAAEGSAAGKAQS